MDIIIKSIPEGDYCTGCRYLYTMEPEDQTMRRCNIFYTAIFLNKLKEVFLKSFVCMEASIAHE